MNQASPRRPEGHKRRRWATVLVIAVVLETIVWRSVMGFRQGSRIQLDQMIFQTGVLSPLMNDYIVALDDLRDSGGQLAAVIAERRNRISAIQRRIEPHLTLMRQTTDLLSGAGYRAEIRRSLTQTIDTTIQTFESAQAAFDDRASPASIDEWVSTLQDNLAFFSGSVVHTIEEDLNAQQERSNVFAVLIGVLFSVLLAVGLALVWLIAVLRRKTEALNRLVMTDVLTGLINRRECVRQATRISRLAVRENLPITVAIVDLDRFKAINDTHGHPAGDAVLQSVATTIDASRRRGDIVARLGGEEFAIVMFDTDQPAASVVCERVRQDLASLVISFDGRVIPVTASIGVATGRGRGGAFETLYARADRALYRAKAMGRDRIVVAEREETCAAGPQSSSVDPAPDMP